MLRLVVGFEPNGPGTVELAIGGAQIKSASGGSGDVATNFVTVTGAVGAKQVVEVALTKLVPGEAVTVTATGKRDKATVGALAPVSLAVKPPAKPAA
jgi:phosphotransferase system HPr-like phosphotransfer protein